MRAGRFVKAMHPDIRIMRLAIASMIMISSALSGCKHRPSPKESMMQKIQGSWVEVRRTNIHHSIFNENTGNFYKPGWNMTITDSNEIFLKIKDSTGTGIKKYPYDMTVYNTGHDVSFGYTGIEIDTLGKMHRAPYGLMGALFKKYVEHRILWMPGTTLGFKHPALVALNIRYKK